MTLDLFSGWSLSDKIAALVATVSFLQFLALAATWGVMRGSARRQLRAYVSITPKLILNWRHDSQQRMPGVSIDLKNHGTTPAFVSHYDFSMAVLVVPQQELPFENLARQYHQRNTLFPASDVPVRMHLDHHLTNDEIVAVEAGTSRFYVWGITYYRDAFRQRRTTYFSFSCGGQDFAESLKNPPGPGWNWDNGQRHNEAT